MSWGGVSAVLPPPPRRNPAIITLVSHRNITFQLIFGRDLIDGFDEGVEFSLQFGSERGWIPITLAILSGRRTNWLSIGTTDTEGNVLIRGYLPELKVVTRDNYSPHSVTVCDFEDSADIVQFRWLQTIRVQIRSHHTVIVRDAWTLNNVSRWKK